MKVNAITTNYQNTNYSTTNKVNSLKKSSISQNRNVTTPTNLNYLNANYNQIGINFRGKTGTALQLAKQIPLDERIASIFQNFRIGDLLLVGKDLSECAKQMYNNANLVPNAIKRSFFILDENIGGNFGFFKNPTGGEREVINLNNEDMFLISDKKTYPLHPQESFYVVDGDTILVKDKSLTVKSNPKVDISNFRNLFAKAFDYESEVKEHLEKLNKKTLSQLIQKQKHKSTPVTFADVGGLTELKNALKKDIIYPIKYPEAYENLEMNRGFILYGPPGTGKTHIARALANEAGANFIGLNGLDLESKWVGESESNWRELFAEAKEKQPTIIFLDEFDAVARSRDSHDEYGNKVVNQILTLMTDIDNEGDQVFIVGATNNYKALDTAITRSGRFGKHYEVTAPDFNGLKEIFKVHSKGKEIDSSVKVDEMLKELEKMKATGADIKHIVNDAHNNGYIRAGIFDKMDKGTFKSKDLQEFKIMQEDFDKALKDFKKDKSPKNERRPIGFNK